MPLRQDLLTPIAGDNPAGASLRYELVYGQIKEARTEEDETLPAGAWDRDSSLMRTSCRKSTRPRRCWRVSNGSKKCWESARKSCSRTPETTAVRCYKGWRTRGLRPTPRWSSANRNPATRRAATTRLSRCPKRTGQHSRATAREHPYRVARGAAKANPKSNGRTGLG